MKNSPDHNVRHKDGTKVNIKSKNHFLIYHAISVSSKIFWPKEIKLAKKLLESFPNLEFWRDSAVGIFDRKPKSLTAYLTSENLKSLHYKYHSYTKMKDLDFSNRKCYTLEEGKVGDDKTFPRKDKNILDFLRNAEKEDKEN
ncbi:hypothetical protein CL634_05245 [bacterium]|nr:hypothetical protein [bacterium]